MGASVQETTWQGERALALEHERLRTVVVPAMGAKIVSLFDKENEVEWLVGAGERAFRPAPYGATFTDQDMSGWDEMFPTISACTYPVPGAWKGRALPDHGEVWALPWSVEAAEAGQIRLAVEGRALPYRLVRTLTCADLDTLALHYRLTNCGDEDMAYIWAAHPQFVAPPRTRVSLPETVGRVQNTLPAEWGWGMLETAHHWPEATDAQGEAVRLDQVGPASLRRARKFYLPPAQRIGRVTLHRPRAGACLRMAWSPDAVPYFGLWIDEGALNPTAAVAAPEPATGFYDSLETAWEKGEVTVVGAGDVHTWTVTVQVGHGPTEPDKR